MDAQSMRRASILIVVLLFSILQVEAQIALQLFESQDDVLSVGEVDRYVFSAPEGAVLSFTAQSQDGSLDPILSILNQDGDVIIRNDDYTSDRSDALIEAFTVPVTGDYTLEVSAVGETSGAYRLEMFEGYSTIVLLDNFSGSTDVQLTSENGTPNLDIFNGALRLTQAGIEEITTSSHPRSEYADSYISINVIDVSGRNGWTIGLQFRQQNPNTYYAYELNDRGLWRFIVVQDSAETVIRDWGTHPAIVPELPQFRLGVMMNGAGFDFFYNGQYIGTEQDNTLTEAGTVGFLALTTNALNSDINVQFDDLVITVPALVDGQRVVPQQIVRGAPIYVARQLQHFGLIPIGGQMTLTLDETTTLFNSDGVDIVPIARGNTFTNLVYSSVISVQTGQQGVGGCGIIARNTESSYVMAYADNVGGYGLSAFANNGFEVSNFNQYSEPVAQMWLLMLVLNERVYLYVDGVLFTHIEHTPVEGGVAQSTVNYAIQQTNCRFRNVWIWEWE
jgi:hypothetical protein